MGKQFGTQRHQGTASKRLRLGKAPRAAEPCWRGRCRCHRASEALWRALPKGEGYASSCGCCIWSKATIFPPSEGWLLPPCSSKWKYVELWPGPKAELNEVKQSLVAQEAKLGCLGELVMLNIKCMIQCMSVLSIICISTLCNWHELNTPSIIYTYQKSIHNIY